MTSTLIQTQETRIPRTTTRWTVEPTHTVVSFAVKHMLFATGRGTFRSVRGEVERDEADFTRSRVTAEIDAASVDTNVADRDAHLRSADFFDVERHPKLTFASTRIERVAGDRYRIVGDLTIRGVAREVAFDAVFEGELTDPWGNVRAGVTAETTINRKDFGLTWNGVVEAGGLLLGEDVRITLNVELVRAR